MDDGELRPPTRLEVITEQQKLHATNAEFAAILGYDRGETISGWRQEPQKTTPTISYAEMLRRIAAHQGRQDTSERSQRERDYTTAMLGMIRKDAENIARTAAAQLDKLELAERYLSGKPAPMPQATPPDAAREADERGVSADLHAELQAAQATRRARRGHR